MELKATYTFEAEPERVFDVMIDPDVVAACLPGCEVFEPTGDDDTLRYRVVMTIGIAAMTGRYEGRVEILDVDRPHGYTITIEGRGAPGSVSGEGRIRLEMSRPRDRRRRPDWSRRPSSARARSSPRVSGNGGSS